MNIQLAIIEGTKILKDKYIRTAQLVGGQSMVKQFNSLKRNPRLIVGTPGRINDHLKRNTLRLNNTSFVALDEGDRMLDDGFAPQINQILQIDS